MRTGNARSFTLRPTLLIILVILIAGTLTPDPALRFALTVAAGWAIAAVGLDVLVGYTGQLSFGQAGFAGLGAYSVAILSTRWDVPVVVSLVVGLAATGLVAYLLSFAIVRLELFGVGITTLFLAYLVISLLESSSLAPLTGGSGGLLIETERVAGLGPNADLVLFIIIIAVLLVVSVVVSNLVNSRTGRAMRLIKANVAVAASCGVDVYQLKRRAFTLTAVIGALAGWFYSLSVGYLSPEGFTVTQSIYLFAMVALGGAGTVGGPILGAIAITLMSQYLLTGEYAAIVFGLALIIGLTVLPDGVFGLFRTVTNGALRMVGRVRDTPAGDVPSDPAAVLLESGGHPHGRGPILEVGALDVHFDDFVAVAKANLVVYPGEVHGVLGPNGAGKTTLLNAVCGLVPAAGGSMRFNGADIIGWTVSERRRAGLVRCYQHPALAPDLTVVENVKLGMYPESKGTFLRDLLGPITGSRAEAELEWRARAALAMVGLTSDRFDSEIGALSLSEQKRVEIARGIAGRARLLLLDEPTAGLSGDEMELLLAALVDVNARLGIPIVVISHHIGFVKRFATRLTVLDYGRVIGSGEPAEVLAMSSVRESFSGLENTEAGA